MNEHVLNINEQNVAEAFTKQSKHFDALYSGNTIIQYKRERVRNHVRKYIKPGSRVLELNSGTGEDAIWLAQNGFYVHATDISAGMLAILNQKAENSPIETRVTCELCSFTSLEKLNFKGPYDYIFSNFAGLNCTNELSKVLNTFSNLLKPGAVVTLVILP
ncbi:MAG TPA: class I SAM-dependent methyltransferase, partial [Chitinophagaceae bacterium]|nr:class I SAM-dependent methyltransferase [Chitinophagaceae bacterium]